MKAYSTRFCGLWSSAGPSTFVVPVGKRAIVKAVTAVNGAGANVVVQAGIQNIGVAAMESVPGGFAGTMAVETHQVANAGETIYMQAGGPVYGLVSGFLLDDT